MSGALLFSFLNLTTLNIYSQVGLITLVGLVSKNGILIVQFANHLRELGKDKLDAVIEAVGKPEVWEAAVQLARKGGTVNLFGGCPAGSTVSFDTGLLHYSNLTLLSSFHHTPRTVRRALELIEAGVVRAADFVDGERLLTELPELFRSMAVGNQAVKTLIRMRA